MGKMAGSVPKANRGRANTLNLSLTHDIQCLTIYDMKKINALELRKSLGKIISLLEEGGDPILVERGRKPAAVLISLEDFKERFVDKDADERRLMLRDTIISMASQSNDKTSSEVLLRELRNSK